MSKFKVGDILDLGSDRWGVVANIDIKNDNIDLFFNESLREFSTWDNNLVPFKLDLSIKHFKHHKAFNTKLGKLFYGKGE